MFYINVFKNKKGGLSACLRVNLGYADRVLSWDCSLIAEIAGVSVRELLSQEQKINL